MAVSRHGPALHIRQWLRQIVWYAIVVASFLLLGRSGTPFYASALAANNEPNVPHVPVPTTLNDYFLPGTQPNTLTEPLEGCIGCHVDHISKSYSGSMMANSARDPLFRAALRIANEDAAFGGEFCIRCHVPNAWLNGRSQTGTGSNFIADDMAGVTCNVCHRLVAPHGGVTGEAARNPDEREFIKTSQSTSLIIGSGAYIIDRMDFRRGPLGAPSGTHDTQQDQFMRSSLMCAACHEIDNPLYTYDPVSAEFVLNALDMPAPVGAKLFPIERTYSEWEYSAFNTAQGVTGISDIYPGWKRLTGTEEGPITVCQDCHMPLIDSPIIKIGGQPREVGKHEWAGGSARWQVAIEDFWDGIANDVLFDSDAEQATLDNAQLGHEMLVRAADLQVRFNDRTMMIDVVNNTGHKLPTGYAEGRRMWLQVSLLGDSEVITSYGSYDDNGYINNPLKVYEIKLGLTEENADAIGRPELAGEGFHFSLNNKVFKDNRIPPRGWTNSQYTTKSMQPVGATYADGVYTDTTTMELPEGVDQVEVRLWYQTASGEYLDFLQAEADDLVFDNILGTQVNWGSVIGIMRNNFDLDAPVQMDFTGVPVPDLALDKAVSPSSNILPGQPISFTLTFSNPGFVSINNVGLADVVPSSISNVEVEIDVPNFVTLNQTGNAPNLAWEVDGVFDTSDNNFIYISGIVNPQLSADTVINNSAVMSGNLGANVVNRMAEASANVVVPRVQFSPSSYTVEEDADPVEVTVIMDKANPFVATTLRVSTQNGTAKAGDDFVALSDLQVTIPAGATSAKFSVELLNDSTPENDQSFSVVIKNASGAALGGTSTATITIENEDEGEPVPEDDLFLPSAQK